MNKLSENIVNQNWSKAELDAYDRELMRQQDERGLVTKMRKDIAKKLLILKANISIEDIADATGLTVEEVIKLRLRLNL